MALHALTVLTHLEKQAISSDYLAGSVNTHAVFLRRIMRDLAKSGLVETREGRKGGYRLARPAKTIFLDEIYLAVEAPNLLSPNNAEPNPLCPTSLGMPYAFQVVSQRVSKRLLQELAEFNLEQVTEIASQKGKVLLSSQNPV